MQSLYRSLPALMLAGFCLFSHALLAQSKKTWTDAEVMKIHTEAYLMDLHNDIPLKTVNGGNFMARGGGEHTDIFRMKEGGHAIEDDPRLLRRFYELGTHYMTPTWSNTNEWADSSGDINNPKIKHHGSLTDLGKQIVLEVNRLGMMVDISHVAEATFYDAVKTSKAPLIASHSSCRALCDTPRNMTDDMIKALAKTNGVMGINFSCDFLNQKSRDASPMNLPEVVAERDRIMASKDQPAAIKEFQSLMAKYRANTPRATLQDVVHHIDHVVKLVGVDQVAIGSDFDGVGCTPEGLDNVSKFPRLTRPLLEKGYSPQMIAKIYHGNLIRVMQDVEKTAASMK